MNYRNMLQEGSADELDAIFKLASAKGREDKKFKPITLEMRNVATKYWRIGGFDTFKLLMTDRVDGGRSRTMRTLEIQDKFVDFLEHSDFEGIVLHIPATEHNLQALATHVPDNRWKIHQDDIREEVQVRAEKIVPIRDSAREAQELEHIPHKKTAEEQMADEIAELKAKLAEKERLHNEIEKISTPQNPDIPPKAEESPAIDDRLDVRSIVYEEHKEEIDLMRRRGVKRPDMTKEFRAWMKEKAECLQPAK